MFKDKYGINPNYIAVWGSIYMLTVIPAYYYLYTLLPIGFLMIMILENIVCYYLFDEEILEMIFDEMNTQVMTVFTLSMLLTLCMFIGLLFVNYKIFGIVCIIEAISWSLLRWLRRFK